MRYVPKVVKMISKIGTKIIQLDITIFKVSLLELNATKSSCETFIVLIAADRTLSTVPKWCPSR